MRQPDDVAVDLVEDGGKSWTKATTSGKLWPGLKKKLEGVAWLNIIIYDSICLIWFPHNVFHHHVTVGYY